MIVQITDLSSEHKVHKTSFQISVYINDLLGIGGGSFVSVSSGRGGNPAGGGGLGSTGAFVCINSTYSAGM